MRLFIIIFSLLVGSTSFAEQIFREDFNNTDSYAPWTVNFSGGASSTYVDIYANYAFLVWYISDSSLAEQVSVSRSFTRDLNPFCLIPRPPVFFRNIRIKLTLKK